MVFSTTMRSKVGTRSLAAYQEFPGDSMLITIRENNKLYFCVPADPLMMLKILVPN